MLATPSSRTITEKSRTEAATVVASTHELVLTPAISSVRRPIARSTKSRSVPTKQSYRFWVVHPQDRTLDDVAREVRGMLTRLLVGQGPVPAA